MDLIHVHDHREIQHFTSFDRLVIVHNTSHIPISVEQSIVEISQIDENLPMDQQVQD